MTTDERLATVPLTILVQKAIERRLEWASLHWDLPSPESIPHLADAVTAAVRDAGWVQRHEVLAALEPVLNPEGYPNSRDYGRVAVWADDVRASLAAVTEHLGGGERG